MEIDEVAQDTYRIERRIPGHDYIIYTYLLREKHVVLIEPGPSAAVPSIQRAMEHLGLKQLSYIIPTHIHIDHGGGTGKLAHLFPQAKVLLHPRAVEHMVNPAQLIQATKATFGQDFELRLGPMLAVPEPQVVVPTDGEVLSVDSRDLQIIYAPGHAPHHIAILDRKTDGLFCGEALGTVRMCAIRPVLMPVAISPSFDMKLYLKTVERLRQLRPRVLFYSHHSLTDNPDRLISEVTENTQEFGDIILKAVQEGKTPRAIIAKVQQHIVTNFGPMVEETGIEEMVRAYMLYFDRTFSQRRRTD